MAIVKMKRDLDQVTDQTIKKFTDWLPQIISEALDVPGSEHGKLTVQDISIEVTDSGPLDGGAASLQIQVVATDEPERRANIHERTQAIIMAIKKNITSDTDIIDGRVYVTLVPGAYGRFLI